MFCEEQHKWSIFGGIVTDFSFANLHAASRAFNNMSLLQYLEMCYSIIGGKQTKNEEFVTIHLCCSHFIKIVAKDVDVTSKNLEQKSLFKDIIAASIVILNFAEMEQWFMHFSFILACPYNNDETKIAYKSLISLIFNKSVTQTDIKYEDGVSNKNEDNEEPTFHSMYSSSRFYKHFKSILEHRFSRKFKETDCPNTWYNPEFLNLLLNKYFPYYPLWSGIMLHLSGYQIDRISNSAIENHFGYLKNQLLKGEKRLRCSRCIRSLHYKLKRNQFLITHQKYFHRKCGVENINQKTVTFWEDI